MPTRLFATAPLVLALFVGCEWTDRPRPAGTSAPEAPTPSRAASASGASAPSAAPSSTPDTAPHPAAAPLPVPKEIQAVVDAADRSDDDKKLDAGRHPGELLAFLGVEPGWRVAEIAAGGGYTTELLARAVGPKGKVYGQNNKFVIEKFADKPWKARLEKPVNANVVRVDRELDDPLPPEAKDLDAVVINLFYHDVYWMTGGAADVAKMNAAVFRALGPKGVYVIVDHAGRGGSGANEAKTLHRIDEKLVRDDAAKAGFRFDASGDFLRNPGDTRDWNDSPGAAGDKRGTSDRFALRFAK